MRLPILRLLLLLTAAVLTTGCASRSKSRQPDAAATAQPRRIGTVSTVRTPLGFVLIDSMEHLRTGTELRTIHPQTREETGRLSVSQQQSPPFFLGDIKDGQPQAGDWVIHPGSAPANAPVATDIPSDGPGMLEPVPPMTPLAPLEGYDPGTLRGAAPSEEDDGEELELLPIRPARSSGPARASSPAPASQPLRPARGETAPVTPGIIETIDSLPPLQPLPPVP